MCSLIQQLISDGSLVLYHDYPHRCAHDFSGNGNDGVLTDTAWTGRGISFPASTSVVSVPDSPELQITEGTIIVLGDFRTVISGQVLVAKRDSGGFSYQLYITATGLGFADGTTFRNLTTSLGGKRYIGANFKYGEACQGFLDGVSKGSFNGISNVSVDDAPISIGQILDTARLESCVKAVAIINRKLTATEHSQLYGELSAGTAPTKVRGTTDDPLHKTDWGANQSAASVSSGQLENTPFQVASGSFKIVNDTLDGEPIKSIECITNGTVQLPAWLDGLDTGWTGYVDTGAGYALTTLTLASLVYTMAAGDKIALSDRAGNSSIVKM